MSSLSNLNTYAQDSIDFTSNVFQVPWQVGVRFTLPQPTWELVRSLGDLSGGAVTVTYDLTAHPGSTISLIQAFGGSLVEISPDVWQVTNISSALEYLGSYAEVLPPVGETGTVTVEVNYSNANNLVNDLNITIQGIPS